MTSNDTKLPIKDIDKGNDAIKLANIISHGINTNIPKENKKKKDLVKKRKNKISAKSLKLNRKKR